MNRSLRLQRAITGNARRLAMLVVGLIGVGWQTVTHDAATDSTVLLIAFAALMGVPMFLRRDENFRPPDLPELELPEPVDR
jgi:hypothetical protein